MRLPLVSVRKPCRRRLIPGRDLRRHPFFRWAEACGVVDLEAAKWPTIRALDGILEHPVNVECGDPGTTGFQDPEMRQSYHSVEDDDLAWDEVQRLVPQDFLRGAQPERVEAYPQGRHTSGIQVRHGDQCRMARPSGVLTLDAKESGIADCARKKERSILPSVIDLVFDPLHAHRESQNCQNIEMLVIDITDAFWILGFRDRERKFIVGKLRGRYFVCESLAQDSRCAPLAWCPFFALIARVTLSLFLQVRVPRAGSRARSGVHSGQPNTRKAVRRWSSLCLSGVA